MNKPTTLRELKEEFWKKVKFVNPQDITSEDVGIVSDGNVDWLIEKVLTSHNTELIKKIEGLKENNTIAYDYGSDGAYCYEKALDEVINLINQEK